MNKKLPYEEALEQQLGNMPLPDEDAAWQRMLELLDKKEKRPPFFFFSTYTGKSVLSLLAVLGFLVIMHATRHQSSHPASAQAGDQPPVQNPSATPATRTPVANEHAGTASRAALKPQKIAEPASSPGSSQTIPSLTPFHLAAGSGLSPLKLNSTPAGNAVPYTPDNTSFNTGATKRKHLAGHREAVERHSGMLAHKADATALGDIRYAFVTAPLLTHEGAPPVDFNRMEKDPPAPARPGLTASAGEQKNGAGKDELSVHQRAPLFVQAGIGVQQQIPVAGQKTNAFNLNGNKNPLSDYIPSLFLRLEKEDRWYVQAEFSYASPQLVDDFSYSRQTLADSAFRTVTTRLLLKKIFYHELPLTFNYYLRPRWSAGAGATYSWFYGAVTEKETATRNLQTQAGTVAKQIVPIGHYTDSFLYRSHTYLLVQTNYQWQNGSAGLRFSKDVQPYIRYTQPDGTVTNRRNWSLELLVRLGLWRSKKF